MKITFLGAGVYGSALAKVLEFNNHQVNFYDPYKYPDISLKDAIKEAEILIYAAPASAAEDILSQLPKDIPLVCVSKGFISLKPFLGFEKFYTLGGAAFAEDIETAVSAAKSGSKVEPIVLVASDKLLAELFSTDFLHIDPILETKTILLCGALKNIYAIAAGYNQPENNDKAFYDKIIAEWEEVLNVNGCDSRAVLAPCGFPDLVLCLNERSRNFSYGLELAEGNAPVIGNTTIEGIYAINSIDRYPDFIVPKYADILKNIIKEVKDAA